MPPSRVFGLDAQTVISIGIHVCNLALLAFIMARFLYKPVSDYLFKRTARISELFMRAREETIEAENVKQQYEQKLQEIEREREDILAAARQQAAEQHERLMREAQSEAEAMRHAASEAIEIEKKRVQAEMEQVIIQVSSAMAQKYVALSMDEAAHRRLFDQTLAELEGLTWWE